MVPSGLQPTRSNFRGSSTGNGPWKLSDSRHILFRCDRRSVRTLEKLLTMIKGSWHSFFIWFKVVSAWRFVYPGTFWTFWHVHNGCVFTVSGSLGTSVFDQDVYLVGASGGVYALLSAHLANVLLVCQYIQTLPVDHSHTSLCFAAMNGHITCFFVVFPVVIISRTIFRLYLIISISRIIFCPEICDKHEEPTVTKKDSNIFDLLKKRTISVFYWIYFSKFLFYMKIHLVERSLQSVAESKSHGARNAEDNRRSADSQLWCRSGHMGSLCVRTNAFTRLLHGPSDGSAGWTVYRTCGTEKLWPAVFVYRYLVDSRVCLLCLCSCRSFVELLYCRTRCFAV